MSVRSGQKPNVLRSETKTTNVPRRRRRIPLIPARFNHARCSCFCCKRAQCTSKAGPTQHTVLESNESISVAIVRPEVISFARFVVPLFAHFRPAFRNRTIVNSIYSVREREIKDWEQEIAPDVRGVLHT